MLGHILSKTEVTKSVNRNNAEHCVLFEAVNLVIKQGDASAAEERSESSKGMADSAPSMPNRFWPRYLVPRKRSSASAALRRSRMRRFSSIESSNFTPSTCCWIHAFWAGS